VGFGLIDDAGIKVEARIKVLGHLLIAALFVYFTGQYICLSTYLWIDYLLTICFITFMTNSMNMLDGMDGLVSGLAALASLFFILVALEAGQYQMFSMALVLLAASLGFLYYNFNPASIFLGESGSTLIGFMLAALAIRLDVIGINSITLAVWQEKLITFLIPLVILGVPIFDTYFVFINRFLNKVKFNQPGKDHSHHRIYLMGFSQKATVLSIYSIQIVLGLIALAMVRASLVQYFALLSIVLVLIFIFSFFLLKVKVYEQHH
jgi:UDP-GlcNAc:undecaprenyl-phosphate GlcNAc-1-phosphate transferase